MTPDDQIDTAALRGLIEYQLDHGIDGFYLCGNTGEGMLLTEEERQTVTVTALEQVGDRAPIIVHVGALATAAAERLARHAREAGAYGVASVPPFYVPVAANGIEEHYRRIARAARLPLYLYYIPSATHVHLGAALIANLLREGIIRGLKYTSYDQLGFREIIEVCGPELNIFSGPDEMLLPFLVMGAHGAIGTTFNCLPHLFTTLYAAWKAGQWEEAQKLQFQVNRIILVLRDYGVIPAVKAAMRLLGLDCGNPRAPLLPLSEEQQDQLHQDLLEVGFFDGAARMG